MMNDIEIGIAGAAGQGMQSIAFTLGKTFVRSGFFSFVYHDLMSRIRGGSNISFVRVKNNQATSVSYLVDVLVALDRDAILKNMKKLKTGAIVIFDGEKVKFDEVESGFVSVP